MSNAQKDIILMALIIGILPKIDFERWLEMKPLSTMDIFYRMAGQYLSLEEVSAQKG